MESSASPHPPPAQEVQAIVIFSGALVGTVDKHHCDLSHAEDAPQNIGRWEDEGENSLPLVSRCCKAIGEMRIPGPHGIEALLGKAQEKII